MAANNDDKRKSVRVAKSLTIQYLSPKKSIWNSANLKNISVAGACFIANEVFAPQEEIQIKLKIPVLPLEWIETISRVIKSDKFGSDLYITHIEFLKVGERHKSAFEEYLSLLAPKTKAVNTEKREFFRLKKPLTVRYNFTDKNNKEIFDQTQALDISETGLGMNVMGAIEPDTLINLTIILPSNPYEPLKIRAKVTSIEETMKNVFKTGLNFVDLTDVQKKALTDFINFTANK